MAATGAARRLTDEELSDVNRRFEGRTAEELIAWAAAEHPDRLAVSCSFGGPTGMVMLDIALKIDRSLPVLYADTEFLFPETYQTVEAVKRHYGIDPLPVRPAFSPRHQEALFGPALWDTNPDYCCDMRKVQPMRVALERFDAYLTGLRRDQASTRSETPLVAWDSKFGLLKLAPLANWGEKEIWSYIVSNGIPYNPLHDRSYPSIGCTNCTKPVANGEDPRSGRWSGTDKIECGLHTS